LRTTTTICSVYESPSLHWIFYYHLSSSSSKIITIIIIFQVGGGRAHVCACVRLQCLHTDIRVVSHMCVRALWLLRVCTAAACPIPLPWLPPYTGIVIVFPATLPHRARWNPKPSGHGGGFLGARARPRPTSRWRGRDTHVRGRRPSTQTMFSVLCLLLPRAVRSSGMARCRDGRDTVYSNGIPVPFVVSFQISNR